MARKASAPPLRAGVRFCVHRAQEIPRVARIAGVNIPTNKRVVIALQYIHGIGPKKAQELMEKVGIEESRRVAELTVAEVLHIREAIDRDYIVE